ncbi:PEP-CTERM/exosortase system-associated acyltransferase [Pelomonas sp. KK5]|uniref:PEP-CTERM/exosortase system-associated acyltransferase n=1 Tax=Pelomonas sp. KK5 TaxID=1855730 RepID=UPI00097C6724|nr:PEP-CTERM/exosortase system-associated acyltransferase [Pelomonas sp. KK5]
MDSSSSDRNLGRKFQELFELTVALDQASIETVYRIRHEVYCRDLGWEPERANGMESDEYDRHSVHCLLRRRGSGEPVGCTRLVIARPESPEYPLPFERSCQDVLDRAVIDPATLPRNDVAEVSRLAVMGSFRQRKGETAKPVSVTDDDFESRGGMPRFPFIPVSLYLGAAAIARRLNIDHVFVLTEPRLASHFVRIGFDIHPVGGAIEHRGVRVPSLLSSSKVVAGLRPLIRPLYTVVENSVSAAFERYPHALERLRGGAS